MRIRKVAAVTMAACLAAGALAGCGSKKSDEKVIKIGVFEPTTGENGGGGYQEVDVYKRQTFNSMENPPVTQLHSSIWGTSRA